MDNYVYEYCGSIYINLTNRCTNRCDFCIRNFSEGVGAELWIEREPETEDVMEALERYGRPDVVFCGYGEPTIRLETLIETARRVKGYGGHTRLNTNGTACLFHGRDIVPELAEVIDCVCVSLNAPTAERYDEICHSDFGPEAHAEVIRFAAACRDVGMETRLSVVGFSLAPEDIDGASAIAGELGLPLRVR